MSFPRVRALRSIQSTLTRATPRVAAPRTQLITKRFASGGHGDHAPSSDLPWLLSALVITPVSAWYLWPEPHKEHHGHDSHAKHEEEHEEKEEKAEEETPEQPEETEEQPAEESSTESEEKSEEKADESADAESAEKDSGDDSKSSVSGKGRFRSDSDATKVTRKVEPSPKGGAGKIRLDSGLGKNLGEGLASDTAYNGYEGSSGTKDSITKKQEGLSNTDTRHSTRPDEAGSGISTKGSGGPETAKHKGTVDHKAPVK